MRVGELINILQTMNKEAEVVTDYDESGWNNIASVEEVTDGEEELVNISFDFIG